MQKIQSYRKKNSAVRHEYYSLCDKYSHLDKYMFTFTAGSRGRGVYTKLRLMNEIKSYVTYLISNSPSNIYFFSNIEIGHTLSNPHIHTQIWSDDKNATEKIYSAVIEKFGLDDSRCRLTNQESEKTYYDYVIKDYSKKLSDDEIWKLEETKKRMRKTLGLKLRFTSKSKGKYTSKMYKMVYRAFRVLRAMADVFLDLVTSCLFFKREVVEDLLYSKKFVVKLYISSFILIKNKVDNVFLFHFVDANNMVLFYSPSRDPPIDMCHGFLVFSFV